MKAQLLIKKGNVGRIDFYSLLDYSDSAYFIVVEIEMGDLIYIFNRILGFIIDSYNFCVLAILFIL